MEAPVDDAPDDNEPTPEPEQPTGEGDKGDKGDKDDTSEAGDIVEPEPEQKEAEIEDDVNKDDPGDVNQDDVDPDDADPGDADSDDVDQDDENQLSQNTDERSFLERKGHKIKKEYKKVKKKLNNFFNKGTVEESKGKFSCLNCCKFNYCLNKDDDGSDLMDIAESYEDTNADTQDDQEDPNDLI
jgi:hypothetical protein